MAAFVWVLWLQRKSDVETRAGLLAFPVGALDLIGEPL
jgi:hypothetical protein